ncbi:MAG: 2-dehydropantoate 2-reductase [Rhodoplanes sp.]|uniref:2-dehydropantoate 2-reductase n=1 Tax=Rhodoplanes sp. TaxID=1968906 RepID=UPI0017A1E164|nr:2-dehydropantoate 2-reductase [Rhodoplanes sp.]NVO16538.1 2-dehydropantoate 2-reductase [Rhodoplanes sp.]
MKVCIFGAGAIGGFLAVPMRQAGIDVSVVARGAHLAAIRRDGLTLEIAGQERIAALPATDDPAELGPQDVVVVTLKAHQAWAAAGSMAPLLGPGTMVVPAQNGIPWWYFHGVPGPHAGRRLDSVDPGGRQWQAIGAQRVIGCTVYSANELVAPGVVRHIQGDAFGLGEPEGGITDRLKRVAGLFERAGLTVRLMPDIREDIWLKLWGTLCFNPISALTRATMDVVGTDPGTRALARAMMVEAEAVGRRLGVSFRVEVDRRLAGAARVGAHKTSTLQDVERGRPLEIDALLTVVQELARLTGIETPAIDAVLALVQQLGRSLGLYPVFPEPAALAEAAAG